MNIDRTAQWKIICLTCHYARWYGQARIGAQHAASQHQQRYPLHRVQVWMLAEDRDPEENLEKLPDAVDAPPF